MLIHIDIKAVVVYLILFMGIAFLPSHINPILKYDHRDNRFKGEELYKSNLTQSNFGLLKVSLFESFQGKKNWKMDADFAELNQKNNYLFLKSVVSQFYSSKTKNIILTSSDYGKSELDDNFVELIGNVLIRSKLGYEIATDNLIYDGNKRFFKSVEAVLIKGPKVSAPQLVLSGIGLEGFVDDEHFFIKKKVTATRLLKKNRKIKIKSENGEFYTDIEKAVFHGNVETEMPDTHINSDNFDLTINPTQDLIIAKGNVELTTKNKFGKAEEATIIPDLDKIILLGNATIKTDQNVLKGNKITLYTEEDRVEVESAKGSLYR